MTCVGSLLTALNLFTVLPVLSPTGHRLDRRQASRALLWLPVVGALLGAVAAVVLVVVALLAPGVAGRLLAAALAVMTLALLTGGMHLDGLADTVDGLGSRRPAAEAMEVMRRSDVGPLGVVALLLGVLVQVSALAAVPSTAQAAVALVLATVTSRTAVVMAARRSVPSARPGGFGSLVAASVGPRAQAAVVALWVLAVAASAAAAHGPAVAAQSVAYVGAGLLIADQVQRMVQRRIGGVTGDVFGALVEITTAAVLVAVALTS